MSYANHMYNMQQIQRSPMCASHIHTVPQSGFIEHERSMGSIQEQVPSGNMYSGHRVQQVSQSLPPPYQSNHWPARTDTYRLPCCKSCDGKQYQLPHASIGGSSQSCGFHTCFSNNNSEARILHNYYCKQHFIGQRGPMSALNDDSGTWDLPAYSADETLKPSTRNTPRPSGTWCQFLSCTY